MYKIIIKTAFTIFILLCLCTVTIIAQKEKSGPASLPAGQASTANKVWEVPFASCGNTISLSIENNSNTEAENISVSFNNLPPWVEFRSSTVLLKSIPPQSSSDAEFEFSIDKKAPAEKDTTLTAVIKTSDGRQWTKEIHISVASPKGYKLYNNYPNPFNPSTKIAFELPITTQVRLTIYDITGRQIAKIADGKYPAGYNEVVWNGLNGKGEHVSSGIYFYRITAGSWSKVMKMGVVK